MVADQPRFDPKALRAARVRADLTQHELAWRIGVAGGERVSRWELGVSTPQAAVLGRLAEALGVRPLELFTAPEGPADLRTLRRAAGLGARDLARRSHIASATYIRWEAGKFTRLPSEAAIAALADLLGVRAVAVRRALEQSRAQSQTDR